MFFMYWYLLYCSVSSTTSFTTGIKPKDKFSMYWYLHYCSISSTTSFTTGIEPKDKLRISFQSYITVSRDYVLPCWYVSTPTDTPWIIHSTDGVSPEFVTEFTSDKQWKRSALDLYEPFTLEKRFFE